MGFCIHNSDDKIDINMIQINFDGTLFFKVFNILNYVFLSILLLSANSINKFIYFFQKKENVTNQYPCFLKSYI